MGGAYRSNYTRKRFRLYYATQAKCNVNIKKQTSFSVTILPGNLAKSEVRNRIYTKNTLLQEWHRPQLVDINIIKNFVA